MHRGAITFGPSGHPRLHRFPLHVAYLLARLSLDVVLFNSPYFIYIHAIANGEDPPPKLTKVQGKAKQMSRGNPMTRSARNHARGLGENRVKDLWFGI